jgi:hypothetical protein
MKTLLAALVLVSTSTLAHDSSFSGESCNVDIQGGVRISQSEIEFLKNDKHLYKIIGEHSLVINGDEVSLSASQQNIVSQYSNNIRSLIPQTKTLATDALSLASDGVNLAFNELLGEGNSVGRDLSVHFNDISREIDENFAANKTIHFDENGFSGDEFFGEGFEERIEAAVEETVQNSLGSIMIAVGQELLFSGGDMDAFETRMENFGEQISHEVESRALEIEKRAHGLCESLTKINDVEENMKNEISELADFNVLSVSTKNQDKA